jgi:hypothetical protein
MLLVGDPVWKTAYSSSCKDPLRGPTIRSVWLMEFEKLSRAPTRTCSTPTSSVTLNAMESTVSAVVSFLFRSE